VIGEVKKDIEACYVLQGRKVKDSAQKAELIFAVYVALT